MEKVTVSAKALRTVLQALSGNPHEIRELQATRTPVALFKDNAINILIDEFNAAVEAANQADSQCTPS